MLFDGERLNPRLPYEPAEEYDLTIEVEHNISIAKRVPVQEGDHVIIHGEYVWNAQGGLIHFTHHDPQGTHEGGYILDGGTTYD